MSGLHDNLLANLKFLAAEADSEIKLLRRCLARPDAGATRPLLARRGYAANLRTRIQADTLAYVGAESGDENARRRAEAIGILGNQLERITEKCRDGARAIERIGDDTALKLKRLRSPLKQLREGARELVPALEQHSSERALAIGQRVTRIERRCARRHGAYLGAIRNSRHARDIARALFIVEALRQMGDALRRGSEAVMSSNLGQPVSFDRYRSLRGLNGGNIDRGGFNLESLACTRSGGRVSGLGKRRKGGQFEAVYKEGQRGKLREEREGVESWHELYPGLAPKILAYRKRGESAALLIEHLPGMTFQEVLLGADEPLRASALNALDRTLRSVWKATRAKQGVSAGFMRQLQRRLPEVYRIHPEFRSGATRIGALRIPALEADIRRARERERNLRAPFSVYIHGDFNVDNIIFDPREDRIRFIDLHRSRHMDYVQDVSVFMVSIYRLQILDNTRRRRLLQAALDCHGTAADFARRQKDEAFELRLALGLARSLCTSTRFILDKSVARRMLLRARYLLRLVGAQPLGVERGFRLPLREVFVE